MKNLPKSLHTVTVLVNVARTYELIERYPAADAIQKALEVLGYGGCPDPYSLARAALKVMKA